MQSGQPSSRPLCKCPESEFYLQSGLSSSRPLCKCPESEFYLQSSLLSSWPLCKYPKSEFYLQGGLPSRRPLCKCPESGFYLQGGLPSRRPLCKYPESEFYCTSNRIFDQEQELDEFMKKQREEDAENNFRKMMWACMSCRFPNNPSRNQNFMKPFQDFDVRWASVFVTWLLPQARGPGAHLAKMSIRASLVRSGARTR